TINQFSYYANLFDTKTTGVDVVADYNQQLQKWGRIRWSLGFNWNETKITGKADTPSQLAGLGVNAQPIDHRIEGMITDGDPKTKLTLGANWQFNKFDINARVTRYGSYIAADTNPALDQKFGAKWIADIDATYHVTDNLSLTLGADNVFNTYPDKSNILDSSGENLYSQTSPFGFYGGYYYGRVTYRF
ncbi:MAG: TonB-dependent receptor, partial [Acinetobacter sp.]